MNDFKGLNLSQLSLNVNPMEGLQRQIQNQQAEMDRTMSAIAEHKGKIDRAHLDTAEAAKYQVEYLKSISVKYEQIVEQNIKQAKENKKIKWWTIAGVIIMGFTLVAAIVVPIILYFISKGGA